VRGGGLSFFSDIALVLIDEVHLLSDPRGASLEAVVSRIKMLSRVSDMSTDPISTVRFIAVSATIPNMGDIGNITQD
jgi:ATP-dependent DNA helicase HFM1/MER3